MRLEAMNEMNETFNERYIKVTSTIILVGLRTFTTGGGMHGPF